MDYNGITAGSDCASQAADGTPKRPSENSEEEPLRKMHPVPTRATEEDASRTDGGGRSPSAGGAAMGGAEQRVRELIASGAGTSLQKNWGTTPVLWALWGREDEAADLFAELDVENDGEGEGRRTALHWAASRGYLETVKKLLARGASTRATDSLGQTPLHMALYCGQEEAALLLAEADACVDVRDHLRRTPLHYAAERGMERMVRKLLCSGHDPHSSDKEGRYPVELALTRTWRINILKMILSSVALRGVAVEWSELEVWPDELRLCVGELSRCSEAIRVMRDTEVGASSVSHHELATRHVSRVAPRLPSESVPDVALQDILEREFPHYADLISLGLRSARERRVSMDRFRRCFSQLFPELAPLPVTCSDIILPCLSNADLGNFICAVWFLSRE